MCGNSFIEVQQKESEFACHKLCGSLLNGQSFSRWVDRASALLLGHSHISHKGEVWNTYFDVRVGLPQCFSHIV